MNDDDNIISLPLPGPGAAPLYVSEQPTLRDQFAMAALTSMLSPTQDITPSTPAYAAELAYKFADAMMEARK